METLDEIILKLRKYAVEYENSGNTKFANASKSIIEYLKVGDYKNAITLFRTSELLYDLGNTYDALKKLDIEDYVSKNFDINWGLKAGEYIAWRSGAIENTANGIFFSISKGGAEAYSNSERQAKKYNVKINKPLIARRAEHAYLILTGKKVPETLQQTKGKDDWWVKLDERIVYLAKSKGYDSVTYTMPAPPALKELILFDKKQVIESFKNGGYILSAEDMLNRKETKNLIEELGIEPKYVKDVFLAKTKNYKPNVYYHLQTGGSNAGVGQGLYLGRDKQALINFYDIEGEGKPIDIYLGNPKWLDLMDYAEEENFRKKAVKKHGGKKLDEIGESMRKLAIENGYDGIRYYDVFATGEEFVLFNVKKIAKLKDGGLIKTQTSKSLGTTKGLNIIPIIREHDMIAECGDCGDKFSYQNSKSHILWECPECKSIKRIS